MSYRVTYDPDAWVRISSGAPEWRQMVTAKLDGGMYLVVIVARGVTGQPRVAEARIEQSYLTRYEGWKRRTVQRLSPADVTVVGLYSTAAG
jgi:hypothetical protein